MSVEDDDGEDAIREQNNEDESMEEEGDVKKTIRKEKTRLMFTTCANLQ